MTLAKTGRERALCTPPATNPAQCCGRTRSAYWYGSVSFAFVPHTVLFTVNKRSA